jgi:hypothetical protein
LITEGVKSDLVEVRYKARLGNNLFQYCLGRILAEELGFALQAAPIPGFSKTSEKVVGARGRLPEQILSGHRVDLNEIVSNRSLRRIVLDGWFQRYEYYHPHRARIRKWLAFDSAQPSVSRSDVVVNVRRTDFVQLGWALPFSYYSEALERLSPRGGEVCIVTDDRSDPFLERFAAWRPRFVSGTALAQLHFMAQAPRLVMSQSTFSWWPTFLGDPVEVVCPVPSFGAWSQEGEARDASLIERDRFICIECHEPYQPTKSETRYQQRRMQRRRLILAVNRRIGLALPEPPP